MDPKELQFNLIELVDQLIAQGRKTKGYRDAAVFIVPQKTGAPHFVVSFRVGRLDDQELSDFAYMLKGMDLAIDYEVVGLKEDRQRITCYYLPRSATKKSTPEPKRTTHSRIDQATGKQEMKGPRYYDPKDPNQKKRKKK